MATRPQRVPKLVQKLRARRAEHARRALPYRIAFGAVGAVIAVVLLWDVPILPDK